MLKAVVFDLDGVITDSAEYHYEAWSIIAKELGISFDKDYNEKLKGVSRMESLNLILDNGPGRNSMSEDKKNEIATKKNEIYKELIKKITPDDLLPGILPCLKALREKGIKVALASVSKNAPFIIDRLGVKDYFDYIADAAKIERSKPFPDIFLDCINSLGVAPNDAIGVEDAEAGIAAIKAAGMKAVGVGSSAQMHEADVILGSTSELSMEVFEKLIS
ncbi:MAG: beta-phosphoglucomutase [Butyrivibrio sp.]|nr:beta-phosphoglucomutase [Butyrivibrio sp.]